jgi:hypothetical protein
MGMKRVTDKSKHEQKKPAPERTADARDQEFLRAENEDDDGYDPFSDRQPQKEPLFERDPWE